MPSLPVDLVWEAPPECPDAQAVMSEVSRLVTRPRSTRIAVRAVVRRARDGRWEVILSTATAQGTGERRVEGESCVAVAKATALIVALAVDPDRAASAASPEPEVIPGSAAVVAPTAADRASTSAATTSEPPKPVATEDKAAPDLSSSRPPPASERAPVASSGVAASSAISGIVGAMIVGDVGTLPHAGPGLELHLGLGVSVVRLEVGGSLWLGEHAASAALPSAGGDFDLFSVHARGCFLPRRPIVSLGACGGVEIDRMSASGSGVDIPLSGAQTWTGVGASGVGAFHVSRWLDARAELGVEIPLARPGFTIEGLDRVHRPSAWAGRLALGLEAHFSM